MAERDTSQVTQARHANLQSNTNSLVAVTHRKFCAALVLGTCIAQDDTERLKTEHLGSVIAFDPQTHTAVTPGLTLEMAQRLDNYYLEEGSGFFPKWAGFKRMKKTEMLASYKEWMASVSKLRAATP